METTITLTGSIYKKETLEPIKPNTLDKTFVAEARDPYAFYYGRLPRKALPNSLFLFTEQFYFLEEILKFSQSVEECLQEHLNLASSCVNYKNKQYPAIRVKHFSDYRKISNLQECLHSHGVQFCHKLPIRGEITARINKIFTLIECETNLYFDAKEPHSAYIILDKPIPSVNFINLITKIRNNEDCNLFDAVQGSFIRNGKPLEIFRIYAEGRELQMLKKLKNNIDKYIKRLKPESKVKKYV